MPEVSTLWREGTWEEARVEDHKQKEHTARQFMDHAVREMVPTGVNIWGGKRSARFRRNSWVIYVHELKGEESISAISSLLKWERWRVFEWFHLVFDLPIVFFSQQHSFELWYDAYVSVERYKRDWFLQNLLPSPQWCAEGEISGTAGSDLWLL